MDFDVNVDGTVKVLEKISQKLRDVSKSVDREIEALKRTGDFTICGDVITQLVNMQSNLRLDLLANRPIMEYQKESMKRKEIDLEKATQ